MEWNWQQQDWPHFTWDALAIEPLEKAFLQESGILLGTTKHLQEQDRQQLVVERMTGEALKTSEIEGEHLNRDSVQSSIRKQFGLQTDHRKVPPAEQGIVQVMMSLYEGYQAPLTHDQLYEWHRSLMNGRSDMQEVGTYRSDEEPMQVVSGRLDKPTIHFEAPPSLEMKQQMRQFLQWFNESPSLPPLTRASITHLYFVCIHPFEDGNGRIARALAEKALSQVLAQPTFIALSQIIQKHRKAYYEALERNNKRLEITDWIRYFAETILQAQRHSQAMVEFLIAKTKLYDRIGDQLNERQAKVIKRLFDAGVQGFEGGLSAENYISITSTSRATATRDLQALVEMGALTRKGELKGTRYELKLS